MNLKNRLTVHYLTALVSMLIILFLTTGAISPVFASVTMMILDINPEENDFLYAFLFLVPIMLVFLLIGILYGRALSKPLFYFLQWIDQLGNGIYEKPTPPTTKGFFTLYKELDVKISQLTSRLTLGETQRKELERMRKDWTAGVTHDLKTPLSYIKGYSEMLKSKQHQWTMEEKDQFISIIYEKALHMEQLIQDLNEAFQFEDGSIPLEREERNMVATVNQLVDDVMMQPEAVDKEFQFHSDEANILYSFDYQKLNRALRNLMMNAIVHNPAHTKICIDILVKEQLHIIIQDNGNGMTEEEVQQLFIRYYRGTTTTSSIEGTGLGMAIAKQLIEAHKGSIQIKSSPNIGTTVTVSLPLNQKY